MAVRNAATSKKVRLEFKIKIGVSNNIMVAVTKHDLAPEAKTFHI